MTNRVEGAWPLYIALVIVFAAVIWITFSYKRESTSFCGIAETMEIAVTSENATEIKRINVVEGQSVIRGQRLVELEDPKLTMQINDISHELERRKAEYDINKALAANLKSIGKGEDYGELTTSHLPALSVNPLDVETDLDQRPATEPESPAEIQVRQLEEKLSLLKLEQSKLNICAEISGIIGSVNLKPGEKAAPFTPILTLHTRTPLFIKGYIHEDVYSDVSIDQRVGVKSLTDTGNSITGTIVGVGARVVEYPVRLRKNAIVQAWGREVVIEIPEDNPFILGEKVLINVSGNKT
ncbi:MAG: hypothetical protein SWE60_02780 [Thermodesulfobacteriota bacterium]|nr:hypothetical protein [Thermodesulfobacteriota bacterium]